MIRKFNIEQMDNTYLISENICTLPYFSIDFRMTGNPILNQKFNQDPFLDEFTGELTEPVKVNEASVMVSGLVPISIEFNGIPIYVNKDLNSPFAFRPLLYDMQVKCFDLHVSIHLKIALCNTSAFFIGKTG